MDEQNNAALPVEPAAETKKKRRPIRHMIWAVCLIALLIVLLGQIAGDFLCERGLGAGLRGVEVSAPSHPRPLQTRPCSLSGASPRSHALLRPARPRRCRSSAPAASQPPQPRGL